MAKAGFPAWRYDPKTGKGKIFQREADVPKGWHDDPHAHKRAAKEPAPEDPNKGLARANQLTKKGMIAEFELNEVEFDPKASADDLAALYLSVFHVGEDEDEDEDEDHEE